MAFENTPTIPALRSLLFIPGNQPKMLGKVLQSTPDVYVPDLEDSIPPDEKGSARTITSDFLPHLATHEKPLIPRINPICSGFLENDLKAMVTQYTYGVSIGKIDTASEINTLSRLLDEIEQENGVDKGKIRLIVWLESALAILNAYSICTASSRIVAVALGAEDFTNDMAIQRRHDNAEISYARSVVAIAARSANILAIDTPFFRFRDPDGLKQDALEAKMYGFRGKFAIHPAQIDTINQVFSPTEYELKQAKDIIDAFEVAQKDGRGSTSLEGEVIDIPVVKRARNLLDSAQSLNQPSEIS